MRVLDLTGRGMGLDLALEASPAYEFLITLCAFCHPPEDVATFDDGPEWHRRVRQAASPSLLADIERIGARAGKIWVNFLGLASLPTVAEDVPSLLDRLEEIPAVPLRLYLLGYHVPAYQKTIGADAIERAAAGDEVAMVDLLMDRSYFSGEADLLRPLLRLPVEQTQEVVMDVLHRWYEEVFRPSEAQVGATLRAEAERRRRVVSTEEPDRAIERVSGIEFVPQPGIRRVVLIPQLAMRPWLMLCEHDDTRLFCYPAEQTLAEEEEHRGRVLAVARALADPKRLRILEAITAADARVPELSERFSLPKSTTYHHLAILRAAGLVRVSSDLDRRYTLRPEALEEVTELLERVLGSARRRDNAVGPPTAGRPASSRRRMRETRSTQGGSA
jgi:DNA-binding transcriptional ArsR family regulator